MWCPCRTAGATVWRAARLAVAAAHAGVNNNLLAPGTFVDELSGNAAVNGIPVTVAPAVPAPREQRAAAAPV